MLRANDFTGFSAFWIPSSLVYTDGDEEFGSQFDPKLFDDMDEPPPVHILYPRPGYKNACSAVMIVHVPNRLHRVYQLLMAVGLISLRWLR